GSSSMTDDAVKQLMERAAARRQRLANARAAINALLPDEKEGLLGELLLEMKLEAEAVRVRTPVPFSPITPPPDGSNLRTILIRESHESAGTVREAILQALDLADRPLTTAEIIKMVENANRGKGSIYAEVSRLNDEKKIVVLGKRGKG